MYEAAAIETAAASIGGGSSSSGAIHHSFMLGGNNPLGTGHVPTFGQGQGLGQGQGSTMDALSYGLGPGQGQGLAPGQSALRLARTQSASLSAANAASVSGTSHPTAPSPSTTAPGGLTLFARFGGSSELAARALVENFLTAKMRSNGLGLGGAVGAGGGVGGGGGQPPYPPTHSHAHGNPATYPGRTTTRYSPTTTTLFHNAPIPPTQSTPTHASSSSLYPPMQQQPQLVKPMPFSVPLAGK